MAEGTMTMGKFMRSVARVAWLRLQERVGIPVPPAQVMVVGDSVRDVACGRANGFGTLAVGTGWTPWEELEQAGADHLVPDLSATEDIMARLGLTPAPAGNRAD